METIAVVEHRHRMGVRDRGGPDRESVRAFAHGPLTVHGKGLRLPGEDLGSPQAARSDRRKTRESTSSNALSRGA
jgi:hypothetical protein